jgi:hypothetical protein
MHLDLVGQNIQRSLHVILRADVVKRLGETFEVPFAVQMNLGASDDRLPTPTSPHSQCALSQDLCSPGLLKKSYIT